MKHVEIPVKDYAMNHQQSVADLRSRADSARRAPKDEETPSREEAAITMEEQARALEATPVANVRRIERVVIEHITRKGDIHHFTASFDEVQRILHCPECGAEVHVPDGHGYKGMP